MYPEKNLEIIIHEYPWVKWAGIPIQKTIQYQYVFMDVLVLATALPKLLPGVAQEERGGFYTFGGRWSEQINRGISFLTAYQEGLHGMWQSRPGYDWIPNSFG